MPRDDDDLDAVVVQPHVASCHMCGWAGPPRKSRDVAERDAKFHNEWSTVHQRLRRRVESCICDEATGTVCRWHYERSRA